MRVGKVESGADRDLSVRIHHLRRGCWVPSLRDTVSERLGGALHREGGLLGGFTWAPRTWPRMGRQAAGVSPPEAVVAMLGSF